MAEAVEVDGVQPAQLTQRQKRAIETLGGDAIHAMLFGGSRSGKTTAILKSIVARAQAAPKSRHAALRYRFSHIKSSIVYDSLPKTMELFYPGLYDRCRLDKQDWFLEMPNGSEIWFGGLDDKARADKILGNEYATVFLNECSLIPWASRNIAVSRMAQKVNTAKGDPLRLRMWYDCNPPSQGHWTYKLFQQLVDPESRAPLQNPGEVASLLMNPTHNQENLPPEYLAILEALPARQRARFLLGLFADESESQLWTYELLDQQRDWDEEGDIKNNLQKIVIAVDPSGCRGEEDFRSDEIGIVVVGLGFNQNAYVLEDLSGRYGATGENNWGRVVIDAFDRWDADRVIGESNYGGDMVKAVIEAACTDREKVPYSEVRASRGKVVRADPIATLFETRKVWMVGQFETLEDQLIGFTTGGYVGDKSPDRADAMIWALTHFFPKTAKSSNLPPGERPQGQRRGGQNQVVHSRHMNQMRSRRRR